VIRSIVILIVAVVASRPSQEAIRISCRIRPNACRPSTCLNGWMHRASQRLRRLKPNYLYWLIDGTQVDRWSALYTVMPIPPDKPWH